MYLDKQVEEQLVLGIHGTHQNKQINKVNTVNKEHQIIDRLLLLPNTSDSLHENPSLILVRGLQTGFRRDFFLLKCEFFLTFLVRTFQGTGLPF